MYSIFDKRKFAYFFTIKHVLVYIGIASRRQFQYVPTTNDFLLNEGFSQIFFLTNVKIIIVSEISMQKLNKYLRSLIYF